MAYLPDHNAGRPVEEPDIQSPDPMEIVTRLQAYATEAEQARDGGPSPRTSTWRDNWDRYWGRYDFSDKADWQSKHVLPEIPQYVDRWASALREALDSSSEWFEVEDPGQPGSALIPHIRKAMDVILARCARTPDGHPAPFGSVFEEQMKLGAMMMMSSAVTWKTETTGGWVAVDSVDPRELWFDPKGRGLYRRRRYEIDKHELLSMAQQLDEFGLPIYNVDQIMELGAQVDEEARSNRERSTGTGQGTDQGRTPIQIDEWRATVILDDGKIAADRALMVVANEKFLIRGPEVNPYNHNKDWIVATPMVPVPMSIYGRSYMEEWAPTADAYTEMTNLILDGIYTSSMKAFAAQPDMLSDPNQLAEGISPNKVFEMEEGRPPANFILDIELGQLPPEAITAWQHLKNELQEGAKLSETALGQLPNKTHIAATAVQGAAQAGSAMIRSMAKTIEQRWLEPVLTLIWETALQYMNFMELADEIGEETARMLQSRREQFQQRKIKFRVRGISGIIDRQTKLSNMLAMIQTIGQNPALMMTFMQRVDVRKLLDSMITLFGVDPTMFQYSDSELRDPQVQQQIAQTMQLLMGEGQQGSQPRAQRTQTQ